MPGPFTYSFNLLILLSVAVLGVLSGADESLSRQPRASSSYIQCCFSVSSNDSCSRQCTGERCLKTTSPGGKTRRECINGTDPEVNFTGHRRTSQGEDAYICSDKGFCNASPPGWPSPWFLGFLVAVSTCVLSS